MQRSTSSQLRDTSDEDQFLLVTLPPSKRQIRLAVGIIAALVAVFLAIAPFANVPLLQLSAFYPSFS